MSNLSVAALVPGICQRQHFWQVKSPNLTKKKNIFSSAMPMSQVFLGVFHCLHLKIPQVKTRWQIKGMYRPAEAWVCKKMQTILNHQHSSIPKSHIKYFLYYVLCSRPSLHNLWFLEQDAIG